MGPMMEFLSCIIQIASKGDPDPVVLIGAVKKTFIVTSTQENNRKKTS